MNNTNTNTNINNNNSNQATFDFLKTQNTQSQDYLNKFKNRN